jgi:hypothetical protein
MRYRHNPTAAYKKRIIFLLDLVNQKRVSHIIRTLKKKPIAKSTIINT